MPQSVATHVKTLSHLFSALIAVLVFAGDQLTKGMVESSLPEHTVVPILPHCFNLVHVRNTGAAFGLFSDSPTPWKTAVLIVVSGALLLAVVGMVWRSRRLHWETAVGLALVLGGALSNLLDRIRLGRVVDFLDFYFRGYHWPSFNLADSAIVVGAGFLIFQVIFSEWGEKPETGN
jgi:signal peptidase II